MLVSTYLASGAAGLLYEVAWLRVLSLTTGRTEAALSVLLATFMGGLALGAALGGRFAPPSPRLAARAYAAIEWGVAAWALLVPSLPAIVEPLLVRAYADGTGGVAFAIVRNALAGSFVLIPAAFLGATFPLAVRAGSGLPGSPVRAGSLYAANTVGAALGSATAGFVLLPALGLWRTTLVGAAIGVVVGLAVFRVSAQLGETRDRDATPSTPGQGAGDRGRRPRAAERSSAQAGAGRDTGGPGRAPQPLPRGILPLALAVSGFVSLGLEVVWTRLLALLLGPTTWAFSLMLTLFIGGLAAGAAAGTWLAARRTPRPDWLAAALGLGAVAILASGAFVHGMAVRAASMAARPDVTLAAFLGAQVWTVTAALTPVTLALGMVVPFGLALVARTSAQAPGAAGRLYAVNTVGAVLGALAAGFLLLPAVGLHGSLAALATLAGIAAAATVVMAGRRPAAVGVAAVLVLGLAGIAWLAPPLDVRLLSSGAYKYVGELEAADPELFLTAGELLYYADGAGATVSVRRVAGRTSLAIDGKVDASDGADMLTQRLLAHVPLLLHGAARDVAVIGLGSGVTPGSALRHPVARVDVLEISPEVVEASRFFDHVNHRPLADPRTRLIVGDGRTHLLLGRTGYDVIVSEPSNPWMAGMAALFTREFFEAARRRLREGGVMCQWAHTYDMSEADLRSIVATFASVFPHVVLWHLGDADLLMVGSGTPLEPRLVRAAHGWSHDVAADLASVGVVGPFGLLAFVAGSTTLARALAEGATEQRDDRQQLEFSGPLAILGRRADDAPGLLRRMRAVAGLPADVRGVIEEAGPDDWLAHARALVGAEAFVAAFEAAARAIEQRPDSEEAVRVLHRAAGPTGRIAEAAGILEAALRRQPSAVAPRVGLSQLAAARGDLVEGLRLARAAVELAPSRPEGWEQLASVLADAGDTQALSPVVDELMARFPARPRTAYYEATLAFLRGDAARAATVAADALARGGDPGPVYNLIGAARAGLRQRDEARRAFMAAIAADPTNATALTNLARLERESGNLARARALYAEALLVDPQASDALDGLADVLEAEGDAVRASRLRARRAAR